MQEDPVTPVYPVYCSYDCKWIQKSLYDMYSSSQNYYYTKDLEEILEQALVPNVIRYTDTVMFDDQQQCLRRVYSEQEYPSKMEMINQYFFYHKDVPRIYCTQIYKPYNRWHDKMKSMLYHKLKRMLGEPESRRSTEEEQDGSSAQDHRSDGRIVDSHLLFEVSEYNPFHNKYYLREQTRNTQGTANDSSRNHRKTKKQEDTHTETVLLAKLKALIQNSSYAQELSQLTRLSSEASERSARRHDTAEETLASKDSKSIEKTNTLGTTNPNFKKKQVNYANQQPYTIKNEQQRAINNPTPANVAVPVTIPKQRSILTYRRSDDIVANLPTHQPKVIIRKSVPNLGKLRNDGERSPQNNRQQQASKQETMNKSPPSKQQPYAQAAQAQPQDFRKKRTISQQNYPAALAQHQSASALTSNVIKVRRQSEAQIFQTERKVPPTTLKKKLIPDTQKPSPLSEDNNQFSDRKLATVNLDPLYQKSSKSSSLNKLYKNQSPPFSALQSLQLPAFSTIQKNKLAFFNSATAQKAIQQHMPYPSDKKQSNPLQLDLFRTKSHHPTYNNNYEHPAVQQPVTWRLMDRRVNYKLSQQKMSQPDPLVHPSARHKNY